MLYRDHRFKISITCRTLSWKQETQIRSTCLSCVVLLIHHNQPMRISSYNRERLLLQCQSLLEAMANRRRMARSLSQSKEMQLVEAVKVCKTPKTPKDPAPAVLEEVPRLVPTFERLLTKEMSSKRPHS